MYSQSAYPIQRIENKDTVVVMTKAQAVAMNKRFLTMDSTIKAYNEAYKLKYYQYHQASQSLAKQDSIITYLNSKLLVKPAAKAVNKADIFMSGFFVAFASAVAYITLY